MATPIVYRWDDTSAPTARGEMESLIDILTACLVDGYGTKAAAGWTKPYENGAGTIAAFRNNPITGTGFYLQVDSTVGATYSHVLRGFESMSSESAGALPFYSGDEVAQTSGATNTTTYPWILIADDRAFYFICWYNVTSVTNSTNYTSNTFFGDLVNNDPADSFFCSLSSALAYSGAFGRMETPNLSAAGVGTALHTPRKASGDAGSYYAAMHPGGGPTALNFPGTSGKAYTAGDQILLTRPHINDGVAYSFRGWLPGYYYPCHPATAFNVFDELTVDSVDYLVMRHYMGGYNACCYFLKLSDWRV